MPARPASVIDYLVIHCSASPNGRPNTARDIDAWHAERGFQRDMTVAPFHEPTLKHIGYHFVIGVNGAIWNGRSLQEQGAHAVGYNFRSIGVCLIGTDRFTAAQWSALRSHVCALAGELGQLRARPDIPRRPMNPAQAIDLLGTMNVTVCGHRDLPKVAKSCPGFDVRRWLGGLMEPLADHLLPA